jgi:hypothetical protein
MLGLESDRREGRREESRFGFLSGEGPLTSLSRAEQWNSGAIEQWGYQSNFIFKELGVWQGPVRIESGTIGQLNVGE